MSQSYAKNKFESISIIIPACDEEKYIGKCLDKLLKIKAKSIYAGKLEIIVVNNNSKDRTRQVVEKYEDLGIILISESKKGAHHARQKGLSIATGNYIACLDADCIPDDNWINEAMIIFQDDNVVSIAGLCKFSKEKNWNWEWVPTYIQKIFFPFIHTISRLLGMGGMMLQGNSWFRKEALDAIGGFDTSFEFWGDDARTVQQLSKLGGKMKYSTNVLVLTSSRRYAKKGLWRTLYDYTLNWFKITIMKEKPDNVEYEK